MFELLVLKKEQVKANSFSWDTVINSVGEFMSSHEKKVTFVTYFHPYEQVVCFVFCFFFSKRFNFMGLAKKNTPVAREIRSKRTRKVC